MILKTKKINIVIIVLVVIFLICLIPIKAKRKDGGTVEYAAVLYKVIVWNQIYNDPDSDEIKYHTGTNVYIFPFNFGQKDWESR